MILYQLDLTRFITIYVGQGLIFAFFVFLAIKILMRNTEKLNLMLSGYYIVIAIGFFINFIYAPLDYPYLVKILNTATNYCVFFGMIFLMVFNLILYKADVYISNIKQILIIVIFGILLSVIFFIPDGVTLDASTNWKPVWSLPFFIYLVIIVTIICVIPTLYYAISLYKKFETKEVKKRWKCFIFGISGIYFLMYTTMISNTLDNPVFRSIYALLSISIVIWGYLLYYGVGKHI